MPNEEEVIVEPENEEVEVPEAEPKVEKPKRTPQEELDYFEGRVKRLRKDLGLEVEPKVEPKEKPAPTGGLDETQLDFLDVKGITESEDIKIIEDVVKKTGMTVRQALKDEYVSAKLTANKQAREVANATPSTVKRGSGSSTQDVDSAIAKFEQTGELPSDYELRSAVVNKMEERNNRSLPSWKR